MSKDTLHLPKTAFSMKASLPTKEPQILEKWEKNKIFEKLRKQSKGKEKFILHDGPPYANGHIHMGTALNKILKDIITGKGPSMFRFSIGYAGWGNGLLEEEFENGDWLIAPSNSEIIFDMPDEKKWTYIYNELGFDINALSGHGGFA